MRTATVPWRSVGVLNINHRQTRAGSEPDSPHFLVASLVRPREAVLDVGCSTGSLAELLQTQKGCCVVGIEADPDAAEAARRQANIPVYVPSGEQPRLPARYLNHFDVVVCADVVEHTASPWLFITTLMNYLAPEGRFVFSIPNVAHWTVRLSLLAGRWEYEPSGLLDASHLRFFTLGSACRLLQESGLTITSTGFTSGWWLYGLPGRRVARIHWRVERLYDRVQRIPRAALRRLAYLWPELFACQFIIEAKRRVSE